MSMTDIEDIFEDMINALELLEVFLTSAEMPGQRAKRLDQIRFILARVKEPSSAYKKALSDVAKMDVKGES